MKTIDIFEASHAFDEPQTPRQSNNFEHLYKQLDDVLHMSVTGVRILYTFGSNVPRTDEKVFSILGILFAVRKSNNRMIGHMSYMQDVVCPHLITLLPHHDDVAVTIMHSIDALQATPSDELLRAVRFCPKAAVIYMHSSKQQLPSIETVVSKDAIASVMYAISNDCTRFPLGESTIFTRGPKSNDTLVFLYVNRVIQHPCEQADAYFKDSTSAGSQLYAAYKDWYAKFCRARGWLDKVPPKQLENPDYTQRAASDLSEDSPLYMMYTTVSWKAE